MLPHVSSNLPGCRYFPCTVEWFLERARLVRVAKGWRRRVLQVLVDFGWLDGEELAAQQIRFNEGNPVDRRRQFLQLQLQPSAREGEPRPLSKVSCHAVVQSLNVLLLKAICSKVSCFFNNVIMERILKLTAY